MKINILISIFHGYSNAKTGETDQPGIDVYHCRNLEHEDMGMMRNYEVVE